MAQASDHQDFGPLIIEGNRFRPRPGVDIEAWAMDQVRQIVLHAVGHLGIDVYLFGSRARADARPLSDADLALDNHGEPVPPECLTQIRDQLERSLVPFTVDIIDLSTVNLNLVRAVKEDGIRWTS